MDEKGLNYKQYVSLQHYIEKLIEERTKQNELQFKDMDKALHLASQEMERRLEGLNEMRSSYEKDRSEFVKVESFRLQMSGIERAINDFEKTLNKIDNRITAVESKSRTWSAAIIMFLVILQIIIKWFL